MSLGVFKRENLISAWNEYYMYDVPDLYPIIVGANQQARDDYNQYAQSDSELQFDFVDETCRDDSFGRGNFVAGGAPVDGYNNPSNPFCHAVDKNFNLNNIAHRLYINLGENRMGFARAFIYVCVERNIPYYFKWSKDGARADNMVIYIEKDRVGDICQVIQDIAEINLHLVQNDRPLPMSVEDCGWFGYGVEEGDRTQSFSRKVTNSLRRAFDEMRMAYNNDNESINAVLNNPETYEQFWKWAEYVVAERFEQDGIPISLQEQMPEEIRMLANMRELMQGM